MISEAKYRALLPFETATEAWTADARMNGKLEVEGYLRPGIDRGCYAITALGHYALAYFRARHNIDYRCQRCGETFARAQILDGICGVCADDLRDDDNARRAEAQAS